MAPNVELETISSQQYRKIRKPLIEKKRRDRINELLTQLKTIILENMKSEPLPQSKLEKADILELTVKFLGEIQYRSVAQDSHCNEASLKFPLSDFKTIHDHDDTMGSMDYDKALSPEASTLLVLRSKTMRRRECPVWRPW
uniref:transcription factor HES-5-like n=1 Tax=Myxine glutinosa TaxID=7769 RepID=UPI00358E5B97